MQLTKTTVFNTLVLLSKYHYLERNVSDSISFKN